MWAICYKLYVKSCTCPKNHHLMEYGISTKSCCFICTMVGDLKHFVSFMSVFFIALKAHSFQNVISFTTAGVYTLWWP